MDEETEEEVIAERDAAGEKPADRPAKPARRKVRDRFPVFWSRELQFSLALVGIVLLAEFVFNVSGGALFIIGAIALIPLAALLGKATEELALHAGPGMGGLLNATFGNAAELILAIIFLLTPETATFTMEKKVLLVEASIIGSILGNMLFILGLSFLVGGLKHKVQKFNRQSAAVQLSMLMIAGVALALPAILKYAPGLPAVDLGRVSQIVAVILMATYLLGLLFSFRTHKDIFNPVAEAHEKPEWSTRLALLVLLGTTALVALMAETIVGETEHMVAEFGIHEVFLGVVIIATVGNAAEHATALIFAWKNDLTLAVEICASSSTQVALFLAPVLVFVGVLVGVPLSLVFPPVLVGALILSIVIVNMIVADGEANWFEGVQLLSIYAIIAAFLFLVP